MKKLALFSLAFSTLVSLTLNTALADKAKTVKIRTSFTSLDTQVDEQAYLELMHKNVREKNLYTDFVLLHHFTQVYKNDPAPDESAYFQKIGKSKKLLTEAYNAGIIDTSNETNAFFELLGGVISITAPQLAIPAALGKYGFEAFKKDFEGDQLKGWEFGNYQVENQARQNFWYTADPAFHEIHSLMKSDPKFANLVTKFFGDITGYMHPNASSENIAGLLSADPETRKELKDLSTEIKKGKLTEKEIEKRAEKFAKKIIKEIPINASPKTFEQKQKEAERFQNTVDGVQAGLSLLSFAAEKVNQPVLARNISVFGGLAFSVAMATHKFAGALQAGFGLNNAMSSLSFVNSLVGAFMGATSPFGDQTTLQFQHLSKQIGQIREILVSMQKEMQSHFELVNQKLDVIYKQSLQSFLWMLEGQRQVGEVRGQLLDLQDDLSSLEKKMSSSFAQLVRSNLATDKDLNQCVYGKRNFKGAMMTKARYMDCLNTAWSYGTKVAQLDLVKGDAKANGELVERLFQLYRLVNEPGNEEFAKTLPELKSLADPRTWAAATALYSASVANWPEYFPHLKASQVEDLILVGDSIRSAILNLGTKTLKNGGRGLRRDFVNKLLARYNAKAAAFDKALEKFEQSFRTRYHVPASPKELDLWQGPEQVTTYAPQRRMICLSKSGGNTSGCDADFPTEPSGFRQQMPNSVFVVEALGLASIGHHVSWIGRPYYSYNQNLKNTVLSIDSYFIANSNVTWPTALCPTYASYISRGQENIFASWQMTFDYSLHTDRSYAFRNWKDGLKLEENFFKSAVALAGANEHKTLKHNENNQYTNNDCVVDAATRRIIDLRTKLAAEIYTEIKAGGSLNKAAQELSEARELLKSFLLVGLAQVFEKNDALSALLLGKNKLLGADEILSIFIAGSGSEKDQKELVAELEKELGKATADGLVVDGTLNIAKAVELLRNKRTADFKSVLALVEKDTKLTRSIPMVDRALARLRFIQRMIQRP